VGVTRDELAEFDLQTCRQQQIVLDLIGVNPA
jgi:hypothetical protein